MLSKIVSFTVIFQLDFLQIVIYLYICLINGRLVKGCFVSAKGRKATIVVRVGNNRPDLGVNPICNRFTGILEEGRPLFLPCNPPMPGLSCDHDHDDLICHHSGVRFLTRSSCVSGAFVSVHFEGPPGVSLSICEAFVYTDQALPIERCPTFR